MSHTFILRINLDNDAFKPDPAAEIARILRVIAGQCEDGSRDIRWYQTIFDANGNDVCRYAIKTTEELSRQPTRGRSR